MPVLIGAFIVISAVFGGYVLSNGQLFLLWQPFELIIIGGAALGAFLIANPSKVTKAVIQRSFALLSSNPYSKRFNTEALALLHDIFSTLRREGLGTIESHIEEPGSSEIFSKYPMIYRKKEAIQFISDYLRLMIIGDMTAYELESLMDAELDARHQENMAPVSAVARISDSLPGFGIVAAILGIVISMQSLGTSEMSLSIAAALVAAFLGVLLAYGFISPLSQALEHRVMDEFKFFESIKSSMIATMNGVPPQVAIEFGRKTLFSKNRPSFQEMESRVNT